MQAERADAAESRWISGILRAGLVVSLALMLGAIAWALAEGRSLEAPRVRPFDLAGARGPDALALLGVVVLAATPAVRVGALIVLWTRERDRRFALVAATVAAVLTIASLLGRG